MVCTPLGAGVIVCGPGQTYRRTYADCPDCKRRRRFVVRWDGYYHGETTWCCACGYTEMDGHESKGTAELANTANRWWNEALSPRAYRAEVKAIVDSYQDA